MRCGSQVNLGTGTAPGALPRQEWWRLDDLDIRHPSLSARSRRGHFHTHSPPPRGVPHGTPQFKMAAMMLSGLSAGSLAAKTALPARSATKARAGQMIQMKPMGASARAVRLSTVASAAPVPGGISSVRYARQCSLTIGIARVTPPPRPRYPATVAEGPLELSAARC